MSAAGLYRKGLVPMVTYSDLFAFVTMLCAVITLVINIKRKKQRPQPGKLRRYFLQFQHLPAARLHLAFGSLVKCIILQGFRFVNARFLADQISFPPLPKSLAYRRFLLGTGVRQRGQRHRFPPRTGSLVSPHPIPSSPLPQALCSWGCTFYFKGK